MKSYTVTMEPRKVVVPIASIRYIIFSTTLLLLFLINEGYILRTVLLVLALFLATSNRPYWIYVITNTLGRDIRFIIYLVKVTIRLKSFLRDNMTLPKSFYKLVREHPDKIAFHTEDGDWSYRDLYEYSNRAGHTIRSFGVKPDDAVGLFFGESGGIRYIGFWLGLTYLRAPIALIPPQLKTLTLIHSIKASKIKYLIFTDSAAELIKEIQDDPNMKDVQLLQFNIDDKSPILKNALCLNDTFKIASIDPHNDEISKGKTTDTLMYICTSGTTGLPKAAILTHMRYYAIGTVLYELVKLTKNDVIYIPLPLHHSSGIAAGCSQIFIFGVTGVLRKKFSVSNFWKDCVKYNCTIAQYIGETCRFLLASAEKSGEKDLTGPHKIRAMTGNGLRPSIWNKFQKTFKIGEIYEFYGCTEGNASLVNMTSKIGCIGHIPRWLESLIPTKMIRCDEANGDIIRDSNGLCVLCKPGEAGLLLGKINADDKIYTFKGYLDEEATEKKIIKDVIVKGDMYFNSGDMMVKDDFGYYYFKDRTGDTFRWRGENVSTTEVENVLYSITNLEVAVYGVEIPYVEGKAGMAAIMDPNNKFNMDGLSESLDTVLAPFAKPVFIRIVKEVPLTPTFKLIKRDLQKDAFDIDKISDRVYFLDSKTSNYIPFARDVYNNILNGNARF